MLPMQVHCSSTMRFDKPTKASHTVEFPKAETARDCTWAWKHAQSEHDGRANQ